MNPLRRPVLSAFVLGAVLLLCSLGTWQLQRLTWKTALIEAVESRITAAPISLTALRALPEEERAYVPVTLEVRGSGARVAHVTGIYDGQPGYYVFSLVRLPDGGELPVNHGFVAADQRADAYDVDLPAVLTGLYRPAEALTGMAKSFTPSPDLEGGTFYARNVDGPIAWLFGETPPAGAFYLDRTDNAAPGSQPLGGTTRVEFSNNHLGYAITWYGLAITLIAVYGLMMRPSTSAF